MSTQREQVHACAGPGIQPLQAGLGEKQYTRLNPLFHGCVGCFQDSLKSAFHG